jgi:putative flippase GtrA
MTKTAITLVKDLSRSQVIRFLVVGFICFLVEFISFNILTDLFHVKYTQANLPAMGMATLCAYFLSSKVVFEPGRFNPKLTFILFMAFTLAGIAFNQFLLWFMVEHLEWSIKLSKIFAVALVAVFNFFTKKHLVF